MLQDENHPTPPIAERIEALTTAPAEDEEQPDREEIERQVRIQYRGYLVLATVIALIVGGVIGHFTPGEANPLAETQITPPPYWGQVCVTREPTEEDEDAPEGVDAPPTATPQPLRIYVSGAVADPDVVALPPDSLLADALEAVGGPTDAADMEALNLAAPLSDHQHIIVPDRARIEAPAETPPETDAPDDELTSEKININQATAAELETLPHIGPALAQRILAYRAEHGPFPTTEALMEVSGIGPNTYEQIAPLVMATADGD